MSQTAMSETAMSQTALISDFGQPGSETQLLIADGAVRFVSESIKIDMRASWITARARECVPIDNGAPEYACRLDMTLSSCRRDPLESDTLDRFDPADGFQVED